MENSNDRQLKSLNVKNNCSPFKYNDKFIIDDKTKIKDDTCNENGDIKQNNNINDYMLSNYSSCNCSLDNVLKTSTNNRGLLIKDGYGVSECNVNGDTKLRQGQVNRHYKTDLQLFPRPYLTTPSTISGVYKPNLESKLINSLQEPKGARNQYYGIDKTFTPMLGWVKKVQDSKHIIQDSPQGGIPSRDLSKLKDYLSRSNDSNVIKNLLLKNNTWLYN